MTADQKLDPGFALDAERAALARVFELLRENLESVGPDTRPAHLPQGRFLSALVQIFQLDPVDTEILALAVGVELDAKLAEAVAAQGGLTLALLERLRSGAWDALCPEAPLRHWRLVDMGNTGSLRTRTVRADERIVQFLLGNTYLDTRLEGILSRVEVSGPARVSDAEPLIKVWQGAVPLPVILAAGRDMRGKLQICAIAARQANLRLFRLLAGDIPTDWTQRNALAIFIDRELALSGAALLIEAEDGQGEPAAKFADLLGGPTILSATDPVAPERSPRVRVELKGPGRADRRAIWQGALANHASLQPSDLDRLSEQFALDAHGISMAADLSATSDEVGLTPVWEAARQQARRSLGQLATRIKICSGWDDIVLPAEQMSVLCDLEHHLHRAWTVNQDWGWADKSARGLGTAVMFSGPSGTGKTMAAEVLAGAMDLDLYRIDLSQVVSKYIGETEKNLARIFDAAEDGGAVLLFDEADALFGKRSEVKDSHDRYANVEVSFLLQRMEEYRGLAILTTNQKSNVDQAFLRRLRYVVQFPFPDVAARAEIWARIFPDATPTHDIDPACLGRLSLAGGSIRSIAFNAAFLAAGSDEPVSMTHIMRAARREYAKLEKPLTGVELEVFR